MKYAFISYCSKNIELANEFKMLLNRNGIETWMAPYDIPAGSKYAAVITKAIRDCGCFLLLLSNESQESEAVDKEVELAVLKYKKPFIAIEIERVTLNDAFTFYIHNKQIIALHKIDENSDTFKNLIKTIKNNIVASTDKDNPPQLTVEDLLRGLKPKK